MQASQQPFEPECTIRRSDVILISLTVTLITGLLAAQAQWSVLAPSTTHAASSTACPAVAGMYVVAIVPPANLTTPTCLAFDLYSFTMTPGSGLIQIRTHFIENAVPTGSVDGTNAVFRLPGLPAPASSLKLYRNGLRQQVGADFKLSGVSITFLPGSIPQSGDMLLTDFRQ